MATPLTPLGISILGSTGSIGTSTLDVVRRHRRRFKVMGLAAGSNVQALAAQIREFKPAVAAVKDAALAEELAKALTPALRRQTEILHGEPGMCAIAAHPEVGFCMAAIVGAAGLRPTLAALEAGKNVGLANKETLVVGGALMMRAAERHGGRLIPVDSEHSALMQCLTSEDVREVKRLILTASGGPLWTTPKSKFRGITVSQALKHPNWEMGRKITIDSATMMNKGLEVIEARWLFGFGPERIDVVVHPQSIVHSLVEYVDGSYLAQLGVPDMRSAISHALAWPRRLALELERLDLTRQNLEFFPPDYERFPLLRTAYEVLAEGGTAPAVFNAAGEEAVYAFLDERIGFLQIAEVVHDVLAGEPKRSVRSLGPLLEADERARERAKREVARRER